jgi:uncharacterized membrane protein
MNSRTASLHLITRRTTHNKISSIKIPRNPGNITRPHSPPVPPQPPVYLQYSGPGDNTRAFSVISYISILWLVGLLVDPENPKVRFHVNQGIILTIFQVVVGVMLSILKSLISIIFIHAFSGIFFIAHMGMFLNGVLSLLGICLYIAYMIIGIIHAAQDREIPLPIIGSLFQILK